MRINPPPRPSRLNRPACPPARIARERAAWKANEKELAAALASPVWAFMMTKYNQDGWVLFTEAAFELAEVPPDRAALEVLERAGKVQSVVRLACPEGHELWRGPAEEANGAVVEKSVEGCSACRAPCADADPIDIEDIGREVIWHLVIGKGATPKRSEPPTAEELAKALKEALHYAGGPGSDEAPCHHDRWPRPRCGRCRAADAAQALLKRCPEGWLR